MPTSGISVVATLALFAGCAGPDTERTSTEGALVGTAAGALVGAGVGYAVAGGRGAGYGAVIGGAGGLVGGAALGRHVAKKKAEFAKAADYMDACISAAYTADQQMRLHNQSMAGHLAALDLEIAESMQRQAAKDAEAEATAKHQRVISADLMSAGDQLSQVEEEIAIQNAVLAQERPDQSPERIERLESEIESLQNRRTELEEMIRQLHAMDNRILASR